VTPGKAGSASEMGYSAVSHWSRQAVALGKTDSWSCLGRLMVVLVRGFIGCTRGSVMETTYNFWCIVCMA
jgi:hypothetical protein